MKKLVLFCWMLASSAWAAPDGGGGWRAGAASVVITPDTDMWMAGYASRKEPSSGKLTELHAKALVLEDGRGTRGVVLALDVVGIDREFAAMATERLRQAHGLAREQFAICCSHTHSGPVVGKNLGPLHYWLLEADQQRKIDAYAARLADGMVGAVSSALAKLAPARLQWGSGLATFAVNRRNNTPADSIPALRARGQLTGPVDHDVPVLSIRDTSGNLAAVLFGYACHATTLSGQEWCGDYPGFAQAALEKAHPGCTALFWAGCGADQNPLPRRTEELAREYGAELAEAVEETLAAPMPQLSPRLELSFQTLGLGLAQLPTRAELEAAAAGKDVYQAASARILLQELERRGGSLPTQYPYPVGLWRLGGEVEWITLGGEVVVDYALRLKRERHGERTWVAGYCHDVMAYIPSLRVLREGGYEGGLSNKYYGLPGLWTEAVEDSLTGKVRAMLAPEQTTPGAAAGIQGK